ncbi:MULTISPECIES: amino acid ABC transporter substrate-binding protein [Bosea]|jgi:general L-amino acid transport system substrate-binding protein|uniref:amino acid ABC transporter substrate-binding protein n=1 Tax=Bosea TaxID=85413 RepID=UPI00214FAC9C|nr:MULTISPECIES: amino acid ABC transporter substrate-binding protein [Bosea]MCR4520317.1 amino acid ABC transporter substrate-binding protein [Bosea sp. 47.2.35]MDR6828660.1 general L-amino acid transport system substrate-binding protein [Bosea robiniae]MDR6895319.1 general L-amino acid transport system substrate-binding protein [Bosea sp. BE109]MDR7138715.1 general L-amino acid transport system substrate-binding protein [Bosea sp. BE168]MDR7175310.1 general L-amino acid transport system subs
MTASRHRLFAAFAGLLLAGTAAQAQTTLERVKQRGQLICGTSTGIAGFSMADGQGNWSGLDVDVCRALAAAIFDDPAKVKFIPLASKDRLTALQSGEIDVLPRTTTWTLSRDAGQGLNFTAVNYYDGQGFQVRAKSGVKSVKDLNGASICTVQGTTNELNLSDYFRVNKMKYEVVAFQGIDETVKAYESGRCDAISTDISQLVSYRLKMSDAAEHMLLPEVISKEPIGPYVRQGDDEWFDIVRWTVFALVNAEELGVTKANLADMLKSENPEIRRLLGVEGKFGAGLGLTPDWIARIVKHVGNYGESYERNLGSGSRINLPRGINNLWSKGGIQFAPPVR